MPLFILLEGDPATVTSAISGMASTIATDGQAMLTTIIPVLAPLVGAGIVARLGYRYVKRFSS